MRTTELASFKPLDGIVIALILAGAIFGLVHMAGSAPAGISIWRDNTRIAWYPFDGTKREISITGAVGPMTIELREKSAAVISSTCAKGLCSHSSPITTPGSQIVCVPNHIVIAIDAQKKEGAIDAINR